jgi:hypothetical protein
MASQGGQPDSVIAKGCKHAYRMERGQRFDLMRLLSAGSPFASRQPLLGLPNGTRIGKVPQSRRAIRLKASCAATTRVMPTPAVCKPVLGAAPERF